MDPISALIAGGSSLLGSFFNSSQSAANVQATNQANQAMLTQQENYNTNMSNTAYQRASADMKAAGLNPMMMFGSGSAASTPSITPLVGSQNKTSALGGIGDAVSHAISAATAVKGIDKMAEEITNMQTEEAKRKAETITEEARPKLVGAETERGYAGAALAGAEREKVEAERKIKEAELPVMVNEAQKAKSEYDWRSSGVGKIGDKAALAGHQASGFLSPIGSLMSSARDAMSSKWLYNRY